MDVPRFSMTEARKEVELFDCNDVGICRDINTPADDR
jgi:hypothetical protein